MNKSVISQQNGKPFQPISCIMSVRCGGSTVSNATLDMFHLEGYTKTNKQTNKQKGSDVDEKNGNSRPPTAVASTRRAGVHSWLCALVCVGEIEKKKQDLL